MKFMPFFGDLISNQAMLFSTKDGRTVLANGDQYFSGNLEDIAKRQALIPSYDYDGGNETRIWKYRQSSNKRVS